MPTKKPTQERILDNAVTIRLGETADPVYQHGLLCQVVLPRSKPDGDTFIRNYAGGSVEVKAGNLWDGFAWEKQPLPYGAKARAALIHINTQSILTQSPKIDLGESARSFMKNLGMNVDGGRDYKLFKLQMKALAACSFKLGYFRDGVPTTVRANPIKEFQAWLTDQDGQPVLWPASLTLSTDYFEDLLKHAVPLDPRAIRSLVHHALAIDAYSFFARRLHSLEKPVQVTWRQFHEQFGQEYNDLKNFKKRWIEAIRQALAVYPDAKVEDVRGGLLLKPSYPPIHKTLIQGGLAIEEEKAWKEAKEKSKNLPSPVFKAKELKSMTVERFRAIYPGLDPYACKAEFDDWMERMKKSAPKNYDLAFLGFAKKWAKGKS